MAFTIDEDMQKKIFYGIVVVGVVVAGLSFLGARSLDKEKQSQIVTIERVTGDYTLIDSKGPSPLYISVKEESTGKTYKDVFVSIDCPLYGKKQIDNKMTLMRFTNMKISDKTKSYAFKGAYEQICTNIKFNPKSGDNYYRDNN